MKASQTFFRTALGVFLLGATFVAIAQFCFEDVTIREVFAVVGLVSLYVATLALGAIGICAHRASRLAARQREELFFGVQSQVDSRIN